MDYELRLTGYGARLLKACVDSYVRNWAGGDPGEQINLLHMQTTLNAMVLDSMLDIELDEP